MNRNLDKAIFDIGKVDALMRSMERLCLDFEVPPEEQERLDTAAYTFYAIWDEIRMVSDDLERLAGDAGSLTPSTPQMMFGSGTEP